MVCELARGAGIADGERIISIDARRYPPFPGLPHFATADRGERHRVTHGRAARYDVGGRSLAASDTAEPYEAVVRLVLENEHDHVGVRIGYQDRTLSLWPGVGRRVQRRFHR